MNEADFSVIDAMQKYGGSFVKALAALAMAADSENLKRIKKTWPHLWTRYAEMAEEKHHEETI